MTGPREGEPAGSARPIPITEQVVVPILGMPRSGTSLVTRMFNLLGMVLGGPLEQPSRGNPRGNWEHKLFQSVNIGLLRALGHNIDGYGTPSELNQCVADIQKVNLSAPTQAQLAASFASQFGQARCWGWKDPRTTLLWPVWHRLLLELGYTRIRPVVVVRHPTACAYSLVRRDVIEPGKQTDVGQAMGYVQQMWCSYYLLLLRSQAFELDTMVLCHQDLLSADTAPIELERMRDHLGLAPDPQACRDALTSLDPSLNHPPPAAFAPSAQADRVYQQLVQIAHLQRTSFCAREPSSQG